MKRTELENRRYPVNEIFYSLQGEGYHSGRPAIFIRFSGCNLKCPFCDTLHQASTLFSLEDIVNETLKYPVGAIVVLTGGEPSLYVDEPLIKALHESGRYITIETNGTNTLPDGIDWVTWSPKGGMAPGADKYAIQRADEIKVVNVGQDLKQYFTMPQRSQATRMYLQPCYSDNPESRQRNLEDTLLKVKADTRWTLSAQMHRYLHIP